VRGQDCFSAHALLGEAKDEEEISYMGIDCESAAGLLI
jgi:hypothetical protein